ncbi:MAG: Lysine-tRNA ligase [Candidatus Woesebacteria bacterium GW2011_GWB1_39_12]|uniref:Lysine--tRNA ligase n=2 Tax=Candidatus Woeseibacteriota TaxID=1752722 RepID=A0A0G0M284_9BACT|nr:MAG: Lysine-tRNA ligase [Candidatus Woesebacteria bacterium GW2011_GWA1_39_12]KKR00958.1 MAG: Lysine-tRNA ligase [Candidatus Woesebacteria bacterium GW2011_GWB1_39_12]
MYWVDKVAKEILESGKYIPYWVDDMKTPSGFAHIGALRGPVIHSLIYRALRDLSKEAKLTFVINDFDPADELPPEFKEKYKDYLGFPLRKIPSPDSKYDSLGTLIAEDFKKVQLDLGVEAEFLSSYEMYRGGRFDGVIKEALDNAEKIQDIYQKVSGSKKREKGWLPFQVECEKCGKLGTTRVFAWDGKQVSYKCEPDLVVWAQGCGYEGKITPFGGTGKLPWKVDWAAHWKVIGVTIEGAGKDHASAGGSYDIAMALCREVFNYPEPYKLPYEWFIVGGRKMSSSKGIGFKAHDITSIFPPALARFLFVRTDYRESIEFNPVGTMVISDIFDDYDKCWQAYNNDSDPNLSRVFVLSQIKDISQRKKIFLPRFRDVANYLQLAENLQEKFEEIKGEKLNEYELKILSEREKYAKIWLEKYASNDFKLVFSEKLSEGAKKLDVKQKEYLSKIIDLINKSDRPEELQLSLYNLSKEIKLDSKKAFSAIYQTFIGKDHGPRAAWFLLSHPKEKVIKRLKEVSKA